MLSRDIHEQAGRDKAHFLAPLRRNAIKPTPVPPALLATSTGPPSPQRKLSRRVSERLLRPIGLPRTARRVSAGVDGLSSLREEEEREGGEHEKKRERRSESPTTRSSAGSDSDSASDSDSDEREHTEDTASTGASLTDARRVLERVLVSETDKQRERELSLPLSVSPSSHNRDSPSDGSGSNGRSKGAPPYSLSPSRCLVPTVPPSSSLAAENNEKGEKNARSPAALNYPSLRVVNFKDVRTKGSAHLQSFVLHVFDLLLALPHREAHSAGIDVLREAVTRVAHHEHVCRCRCFCHVFCTLHQTPNKRLREARARWQREVHHQRDESLREALTELSVKVLRTSNVAEIEKTRDLLATAYLTLVVRAQRQSLCARASGSSASNVSSSMCSVVHSARSSSSSSSSVPVSEEGAPVSDMDKFRAMSELFDLNYFRTETFKELAQTHPQRAVVQRMEQHEQKLSLEERVKNMQRKREQQRAKAAAALVHRYRSEQSRSRLSHSHGNNDGKINNAKEKHTSTDEAER